MGQVLTVYINKDKMINYINEILKNKELALRFAARINLGVCNKLLTEKCQMSMVKQQPEAATFSMSLLQAELAGIMSKRENLSDQIKTLEANLESTKALSLRLTTLKASSDLLTLSRSVEMVRLNSERTLKLSNSDKVRLEITKAEARIAQLKHSKELLQDDERARIFNKRAHDEARLVKSKQLLSEILTIEQM